jgi:hypothetical protein
MTKVFKFPEVLFKNPEVFEVLGGIWTDFDEVAGGNERVESSL